MRSEISIAQLRSEFGDTLAQFGVRIGIISKGNVSTIERENRCALAPALRIEEISGGRIDAADLNDDVRAARERCRHVCDNIATAPAPSSGNGGDITAPLHQNSASPAEPAQLSGASGADETGVGAHNSPAPVDIQTGEAA